MVKGCVLEGHKNVEKDIIKNKTTSILIAEVSSSGKDVHFVELIMEIKCRK
jgi:hypothetical protein